MSSFSDEFDELDKLILETRDSMIAKLDDATDFSAVLADIYAKAGRVETPENRGVFREPVPGRGPDHERGGLDALCDRIDMLNAVLEAATTREEVCSPVLGTLYLSTARQSLLRLRDGLSGRRLSKNDALRLIGNVEHNLREADAILRTEHGLSLDEALHDRIGELRELGGDIASQIQILREKVARLFDDAADPAVTLHG